MSRFHDSPIVYFIGLPYPLNPKERGTHLAVTPQQLESRGASPVFRESKCGDVPGTWGLNNTAHFSSSAIPFEPPLRSTLLSATYLPMDNAHPSKRRRTTLACDACRARRTKCDSRRPACQYCQTQNMVCVYQEPPPVQPSRVEAELSAMNKRLDQLFSLLVPVAPISPDPRAAGLSDEYDASTEAGASPFDLPSKLLGNSSVMDVLGLDTDFAKSLIRGERTAQADESSEGGRPHLLIVHHRHAVR
ncbi:hypothetical protein AnigIFM62618_011742 [Aspergillus niger]|nr:hypothetical protein AnigIFM62618_011742 [Aspergillus niger]